jgi:hypothetical protein
MYIHECPQVMLGKILSFILTARKSTLNFPFTCFKFRNRIRIDKDLSYTGSDAVLIIKNNSDLSEMLTSHFMIKLLQYS